MDPHGNPGRNVKMRFQDKDPERIDLVFTNPVTVDDVHSKLVWLCSVFECQSHNFYVRVEGEWFNDAEEEEITFRAGPKTNVVVKRLSRYGILVWPNNNEDNEMELTVPEGADCTVIFDMSCPQEGYIDGPKYSSSSVAYAG